MGSYELVNGICERNPENPSNSVDIVDPVCTMKSEPTLDEFPIDIIPGLQIAQVVDSEPRKLKSWQIAKKYSLGVPIPRLATYIHDTCRSKTSKSER